MQSTESVHRNRMAERFSGYLFRGLLLLPWIVSMGIAFLFVLPVWVTEKYRKVFWFTIFDLRLYAQSGPAEKGNCRL